MDNVFLLYRYHGFINMKQGRLSFGLFYPKNERGYMTKCPKTLNTLQNGKIIVSTVQEIPGAVEKLQEFGKDKVKGLSESVLRT